MFFFLLIFKTSSVYFSQSGESPKNVLSHTKLHLTFHRHDGESVMTESSSLAVSFFNKQPLVAMDYYYVFFFFFYQLFSLFISQLFGL